MRVIWPPWVTGLCDIRGEKRARAGPLKRAVHKKTDNVGSGAELTVPHRNSWTVPHRGVVGCAGAGVRLAVALSVRVS